MRRRSLTGPVILLLMGALFLWSNLHPEAPVWYLISQNWPFLLIGWGVIRLFEVLFFEDDNSHVRGSFSGGEVWLVVLICIFGFTAWQVREAGWHFRNSGFEQWFGQEYEYTIAAAHDAAGIKRVVFENPRGNINISGADTKEVKINGHKLVRAMTHSDADRVNEKLLVEIVPQGDRLLVRANSDQVENNQRVSADLTEVTVPRGTTVEIRGRQGGDYEVTDISGDVEVYANHGQVRLSKVGGNVRIEVSRTETIRAVEVKGKVDIQGQGSDLELESIDGPVTISGSYTGSLDFKKLAKPLQFEGSRNTQLNAQAVPGEINMDLGQLTAENVTGPLKITTRSRDIHIGVVTHSVEVETERGDISLTPGLPLPAIEAHSGAGRIELALPDKAIYNLEATAEHGDATNDFGGPIAKQTEGRSATLKGRNGDGPTVRLTANRGSVEIRKAEGVAPSGDDKKSTPKSLKDSEVKL